MTTTITLPSAVVEQALDALEAVCGGRCNAEYNPCWQREVAETLRAALAQQAEKAWICPESPEHRYKKPGHCEDCGRVLMLAHGIKE
jgi:hypothetical protein